MNKRVNHGTSNETSASTRTHFPILELPVNLIYAVLSRLPIKTVFSCECVCKTFLHLLKDSYFAELHLIHSSTTTASLIYQDRTSQGHDCMSMLDLKENQYTSPGSTTVHSIGPSYGVGCWYPQRKPDLNFCYFKEAMRIVGSCNGLICLYKIAPRRPIYCIVNPILGQFTVLPHPTPPTQIDLQDTGFGFCPKSKQYKIIRFMLSYDTSLTKKRTVAEVLTLGTKSWRNIGDVPNTKSQIGFDPLLNGSLYWITDSKSASDLICSFDLETEKFKFVPPPSHFDNSDFLQKISTIDVGSIRGCLCLCYVFEDLQFSVWVMRENGSDKCWSNEFSIDFRYYCGLTTMDFRQPIKFVENRNGGELLLLCNFVSLIFYSPKKKTFRDFGILPSAYSDVFAYTPSFIPLKDISDNLKVRKFKLGQRLSPLSLEWSQEELLHLDW